MTHPYPAIPTQVIWTSGSDREIGRQHGEAVRDSARKGMSVFYHDFFKRILTPQGLGPWETAAVKAATKFVDPFLVNRLQKQVPFEFKERLRGLEEATGIPHSVAMISLILPDLLPILQAYLIRFRPKLSVDVAPPPQLACSSFVASGKEFLHGRNLDFPGVAYWDRYQVIQCTSPLNGLRHIAFTTAGAPLGGITGVNEAQVSVSLHQHYSTDTSLSGVLPYIASEAILKGAKSATDALAILKQHRLASSWAFVVCDGKSRDAFIYEAGPSGGSVRWLKEGGGVLTHSNFFQCEDRKPAEYATTERMNWDNCWRNERLQRNVRGSLETLDARMAATFISEHYDGYWDEEKIINRTVSQVYNIQSLVLDPEQMVAYLAEGDCPIHLRQFRRYDLNTILNRKEEGAGDSLPGYAFQNPKLKTAKEAYIFSFVAAFDNRFEEADRELSRCLEEAFTPEAALVAAMVNLKNGGDLNRSQDLLEKARAEIESKCKAKGKTDFPPEYFEAWLYQARVLDLKGKRAEAERVYADLAGHGALRDRNIRALAKMAGPYTSKRLGRMMMPYSTYIPFE